MRLDDLVDTNPTTKKMRLAAKTGKLSTKSKELTTQKANDGRQTARYDSGSESFNSDGITPDTTMGGAGDFSS